MILSSSFSINMLSNQEVSYASFEPLSLEEAKELIDGASEVTNMVNPRHESTARLSELLCGLAAEGGFLSLEGGKKATILVMLPPRSFMSRSGAEVDIKDLNEVQFFEVGVNL